MNKTIRYPFQSSVQAPADFREQAYWYVYRKGNLLVYKKDEGMHVPFIQDLTLLGLTPIRTQYVGKGSKHHVFSAEVDAEVEAPDGYEFQNLRRLFEQMPAEQFEIAFRTIQIVAWDRNNQFCGHCGQRMETKTYERAKVCPNCGLTRYPRISPAIIVAVVKDDDKLLMARGHRYPPGWYSVLAGFVEPGETIEETVVREVKEETNIDVTDVQYFGSQPWPFPDSLMLGFTATYAGGEIELEEEEIEDAQWFTVAKMPALIPSSISISRQLIDWFVDNHG